MDNKHNDINEKALYVLRVDNSGKFYTEYLPIPIEKALYEKMENLEKKMIGCSLSSIKQMFSDFWNDIQKNHSYLFGLRYYCSDISGSYISPINISTDSKIEINNCLSINNGTSSTKIDYFFNNFFDSYFIEKAYKECENSKNIKAYSHRILGNNSQSFKVDNILSVYVATNFGYGWKNYFCVNLFYDEIKISPYSRLVNQKSTMTYILETIEHTLDFYMREDSWELAFDKIKDIGNYYLQEGKENFIKKYFADELDVLTSKLKGFLYATNFEFTKNFCEVRKETTETITLYGFPLIVFRGEKVAGAVGLVESIKKVNKIMPTQKYIDVIIDCSKIVLPQLNKAIEELNLIINNLENDYKKECEKQELFESKFKETEIKMKKYNELENELSNEIYESIKNDNDIDSQKRKSLVNEEMQNKYSDWEKDRKKEIDDQKIKCSYISSDVNTHKSYQSTISKYKEEIETFIVKQSND